MFAQVVHFGVPWCSYVPPMKWCFNFNSTSISDLSLFIIFLVSINCLINDKDIFFQTLNSLPSKYTVFVVGFSHLHQFVSFHGLSHKLLSQVQNLDHHSSISSDEHALFSSTRQSVGPLHIGFVKINRTKRESVQRRKLVVPTIILVPKVNVINNRNSTNTFIPKIHIVCHLKTPVDIQPTQPILSLLPNHYTSCKKGFLVHALMLCVNYVMVGVICITTVLIDLIMHMLLQTSWLLKEQWIRLGISIVEPWRIWPII